MLKRLLILLCFTLLVQGCSTHYFAKKPTAASKQRAVYIKQLRAAAQGKTKREYTYYLERELDRKQAELSALEGMRRSEENFLSHDEQREREITRSGDEQSMFAIGNSSRASSLKDIEVRLKEVENAIFDIRTLLSEL